MTDCQKEAAIPLKQIELDFEPKKSGKWARFNGLFLNKIKLIALAVLILILLIIIIILAAVLGHEQSKNRREMCVVDKEKEKEVGPTPVGPTPVGSTTAVDTTGPWLEARLPNQIQPSHYNITLHIDLTKPGFNGTVHIWINVSSPTHFILLHTRNMNFTRVEVQKEYGDQIPVKRHFEFDKNHFHVIELESSLDQGVYITTVEYSGKYSDDLRGLYKAYFLDKNGNKSFFAATQFEPLKARRAFPCFDEPALKATFNVTLIHDPNVISLSNMPIYQSHEKGGWRYDRFEKSVKMPTYLVAFFVGDFKFKETETDKKVKIRIFSRDEVLDQVDYALKVTNQTMMFFEDFFGVPYSLPKSDGLALPAFGPAGMENWGLIKYRESLLLLKEGITSESTRESITRLVAHEVAHQWFGNIATMEWWTDLWLNEGFATYVSVIGTQHLNPEWHTMAQFVVKVVQNVMEVDGLTSSHPVRIPVEDPQKILEIFDAISYMKGGSILLMLHHLLGDAIFRDGLTRYLTKHAFGNADTEDLWNAMTEASQVAGKTTDVRKIMNTFTLQMGYPVVTITKSDKRPDTYLASQARFLYYRQSMQKRTASPNDYKWVIPFSYYTGRLKTSIPPNNVAMKIIEDDSAEISWDGIHWIKGNIGQTGFYRVNYEEGNWEILSTQLDHDLKVFNNTDRAGLIDDSFNLARANLLNHTIPLKISEYLVKEEDYIPLLAAMTEFERITKIIPSTRPVYPLLQRYVALLTKNQYNKLGIEDKGDYLTRMKRVLILKANCMAGGASCLRNMSRMFYDWMSDPVTNVVPANLKQLVYHVGVLQGGETEWNFVYEQFTNTRVPSDKRILLYAMAGSQEPWIIKRFLSYTLDSSKIGSSYLSSAFYDIAHSNALGTDIAWDFLQLKFDEISRLSGGPQHTLRTFIPSMSSRFSTDYQLQQMEDFVNTVRKDESPSWSVSQAIEKVKINIQWRKTHETDVYNWLRKKFYTMQPDLSQSK
ncbi:glutamyl aminopeptidase-like [Montipora capricornis]|uniref:glutamyl aminopeptidase-like n=1 Tax=Montipora capricornis TaxID=246305 RepID=UPI0035F19F29